MYNIQQAADEFFDGSGAQVSYGGTEVSYGPITDGTSSEEVPNGPSIQLPPHNGGAEPLDEYLLWGIRVGYPDFGPVMNSSEFQYWRQTPNFSWPGPVPDYFDDPVVVDIYGEGIQPIEHTQNKIVRGYVLYDVANWGTYFVPTTVGSADVDTITGQGLLFGLDGNDILTGLEKADTLYGGSGDDFLFGGAGGDVLDGGAGGIDLAMYDGASERVIASLSDSSQNTGDAAGDTYFGIEGLSGTHFNDRLTGNDGNNYLYGRMGDDMLIGSSGNDVLDADIGNDTLSGGSGNDSLYGGDGNDVMWGDAGDDFISGGAGNDVLDGGAGADRLDGGVGTDWVSYSYSTSGVYVSLADGRGYTGLHGGTDANGDTYFNVENVEGGNGVDILAGNNAANHLKGLGSDDILQGGGGADTLDGGAGFNWASYATATAGVTANLGARSQNTGDAAGDVYISMHGLQGSNYGDKLAGDAGGNALSGLSGNDTLDGGAGADVLEGGAGWDTFVFSTALGGGNVDRIADFNTAEDGIYLSSSVFAGLGYIGPVWSGNFKIGASATGFYDRIIYNSTTGELFYDADGSGAIAQVKFAEISKGLALTSWHFSIV